MSEVMVIVRVECRDLPGLVFEDVRSEGAPVFEPVHLGIQKGNEVVGLVPGDSPSAALSAEFRARPGEGGSTRFLGPFAKGPASDRFFYLSWGVPGDGGSFTMFRRLKVRLAHLSWPVVARAAEESRPLRVHLSLTDERGEPLCATPPPTHVRWTL